MQAKITHTLIIPADHANERLDQALSKLLPDFSRTQIKNWIEDGAILVNGKPAKAKVKLKGGESVSADLSPKRQTFSEPEPIQLDIVYEDDALVVINKPVGMVVHPGAGNPKNTLLNALLYHCPALKDLPRAGIIHRLDKGTSGLLVVAKTQAAFKSLTQQLKKRLFQREYQAIVYGPMISGGKVEAAISRHPLQRKRMGVNATGKPAVTHYRVIEKYPAHTLLRLQLETGRTHQIRVHMAHIHHPIVGDQVYGRLRLNKGMSLELTQTVRSFYHQALHACALGIAHPLSQQALRWEVDLPSDMQNLITALRKEKNRT